MGVVSIGGAVIDATRFVITGSALCGLQVAVGRFMDEEGSVVSYEKGGTIDLHDGYIVNNPIGANIQTDDFDVERLRDNVRWDNYDIDIDTSEIYVPTATGLLEDLP